MKVEALIFNIIAVFCVVAAVVYGVLVAGADRHDGAGALRRPHRPDRRLLLVRLPAHRRPARGPQGRRHRRRCRRARVLQPRQLLAVRAGRVRRPHGPGAGVLLLVADPHRRRRAAASPSVACSSSTTSGRTPRRADLAPLRPRAPPAIRGRGPRSSRPAPISSAPATSHPVSSPASRGGRRWPSGRNRR